VLTRFEVAGLARLLAKRLDGVEHIAVLHGHRVAQFRAPFRILAEELEHIRKRQQSLHVLVQGQQGLVRFIRLVVVRLEPLQGGLDLIRQGRRRQHVSQQRVGV
jgi:hypothetical protein